MKRRLACAGLLVAAGLVASVADATRVRFSSQPRLRQAEEAALKRARTALPPRQATQPFAVTAPLPLEGFAEVAAVLRRVPQGRSALAKQLRTGTRVTRQEGPGAFFDPPTNTISISQQLSPEDAAVAFVHEMTHAEFGSAGRTQIAASSSLKQYMLAQLRQEAEAFSREARAHEQFQRRPRGSLDTLFTETFAAARANGASRGRAVRQARDRIYEAFLSGSVLTGVDSRPYPDVLAEFWQQQQPTR
jgi:hypothetical protein